MFDDRIYKTLSIHRGLLRQGVEEALLMMRVGDRWELTCPANLAFGDKGRPPSPGRPRYVCHVNTPNFLRVLAQVARVRSFVYGDERAGFGRNGRHSKP